MIIIIANKTLLENITKNLSFSNKKEKDMFEILKK
jgi:hypothetical protein